MSFKLSKRFFKVFTLLISMIGMTAVFASGSGIGSVATHVISNLKPIAQLVTAVAFVGGMVCVVMAIIKFKAMKEQQQQVTLGVPVTYLLVGSALLFTPMIFKAGGATLFGGSATKGTISGAASF